MIILLDPNSNRIQLSEKKYVKYLKMKKVKFLMLIFNILFCSQVINSQIDSNIWADLNPPGTIKINDSLYIDSSPVTNFGFLEYLTSLEEINSLGLESTKEYTAHIKATKANLITVIKYPSHLKILEKQNNYLTKKRYFKNVKYQYFPVLTITKEQAIEFCEWRTEMVKLVWKNKPEFTIKNRLAEKIKYRLPTIIEYNKAAYAFGLKNKLKIQNKKSPLKFKPSKSKTNFFVFNISEYSLSDAIFNSFNKEQSSEKYINEYMGFRCICEVKL